MEVAPRIQRVGAEIVSSYLVEDGGEVVLVDASAPANWSTLRMPSRRSDARSMTFGPSS